MFRLLDAQARNRLHPDTFPVPSAEELAKVKVGDYVKLGIEVSVPGGPNAERMWFRVVEPGLGQLDNDPILGKFHQLEIGDTLKFEPRHVVDILPCQVVQR